MKLYYIHITSRVIQIFYDNGGTMEIYWKFDLNVFCYIKIVVINDKFNSWMMNIFIFQSFPNTSGMSVSTCYSNLIMEDLWNKANKIEKGYLIHLRS